MCVNMDVMGGFPFALMGMFLASELGIQSDILIIAFMAAGFTVGLGAWWFSPLPATNGGFGCPPAKMQKWGFNSEPRHEYKNPTPEDVMTIPLLPAYLPAEREDGDE